MRYACSRQILGLQQKGPRVWLSEECSQGAKIYKVGLFPYSFSSADVRRVTMREVPFGY